MMHNYDYMNFLVEQQLRSGQQFPGSPKNVVAEK